MIPIVGKLMTPAKPTSSTCPRNRRMSRVGSVPLTPAMTGVSCTTRRISRSPMSIMMALASPSGRVPALEPMPAMRKRPELYTRMRSAPPWMAALADSPVPAPAPTTGAPPAITPARRSRTASAGVRDSIEVLIVRVLLVGGSDRARRALALVDGVQDRACRDGVADAHDVGTAGLEVEVQVGDRLVP